jgi:hypothetical protein
MEFFRGLDLDERRAWKQIAGFEHP